MFSSTGRLSPPSFIDDNNSLADDIRSPFTNEFINSSTFGSESLFDRIFPFSPLERYKDTSLRHMSKGTFGSPPHGIVRNIPIKVESTPLSDNDSGSDKLKSNTLIFPRNRHYQDEPSTPIFPYYQDKFESGGRSSPPPPPQRKFINPSILSLSATPGSSSSSNEFTSSDDDHKWLKKTEKSDSLTTKTSNRPSFVSKTKFDNRNNSTSLNDVESDNLQKSIRMDSNDNCLDSVTRKLQKIGTTSMDDSSSSSLLSSPTKFATGNESESDSAVIVNTTIIPHDELSSSSPSSSGIVADMNDSNGESNQRTSATSSLSSCEQSSDLIESNYDTSRMGRIYRSRIDDPKDQQQLADHFNDMEGIALTQRQQFEQSNPLMTVLDEKAESNSKSILQDNFINCNTVTCPGDLKMTGSTEQRFNLSLNLNNQRDFMHRSSSIPPESMHGNKFTSNDHFKRSESIAPELINQRRSLESSNGNNSTNEENIKKQIICSKLVEYYRNIENSVEQLDKFTATNSWRQPHILQQNIFDIKEYIEMITISMNYFLNVACHIIVDITNPKGEELKQLLLPLKSSTAIITQLKQNLDNTGWTLSALSRPRNVYGTTPGSDALDQFLAVIKQLPIDCCKLIQWALLMVPSSTVHFLTNTINDSLNSNEITTSTDQSYDDPSLRICETNGRISVGLDSKRQTGTSNNLINISNLNDSQTPQSILTSRTTFGPSTTTIAKQNRVTFADDLTTSHQLSNSILETHVLEEDDLESVISDRDSFYQDSTTEGDDSIVSHRMRPITSIPPLALLNTEVIKSLSKDDRQLIEFYSPQLDAHTEFLSKAIEEFLTVIEEQMPPHEFVQKGKLIILTAHKLIYMADTIAECISSVNVSQEVKHAADRLLHVLKTCVQATKHAADEYLSVSAVQSMANCIVTVSRAAYDLKLLVKQCCSND
uniref:SH3 domain-containing protein n=1 Tax=Brugia malayi TaxID=6279 RepID=A0A5S6PWA6_BRUMA